MAAETLTGARAVTSLPVYAPVGQGAVGFAYGLYEVPAAPEDGDIFEMCRVPAGCMVIDGFLRADDMDTGIEALDCDVGWAANGSDAADPDGFGNIGVWTAAAIVGIKPDASIYIPFNGVLKDGPKTFVNETVIQVENNVAAATFAAGTIYVGVYYIMP